MQGDNVRAMLVSLEAAYPQEQVAVAATSTSAEEAHVAENNSQAADQPTGKDKEDGSNDSKAT